LEAVKKCDLVYLESYTSKLACSVNDLEKLYGKKIILADREMVEQKSDDILQKDKDVAFLVIGDPFGATTHTDLRLRAKEKGIPVKVIHNASIMNAIGITGLELYKFGKTTSIPYHNENVTSPIEVMKQNQSIGLHTLFLLDLDPKNNKYMSGKEAADYLTKKGVDQNTKAVLCAQIGSDNPTIVYKPLKDIPDIDKFPQCIIIPGKLHFVEEEALESFT
ncbi:MAG: diphthine synthase, partial [Nanoarchaeota archaeon]|nr:diphthine synthase [Nanoarchaeota archaeon]